jgi:conjugative transfer region protein TrbK
VDPKALARIGAIAFVAVAITATVIELSRKEERTEAATPRQAQVGAADPLRDELFRCQSLGEAGPRDPACLRLGGEPPALPDTEHDRPADRVRVAGLQWRDAQPRRRARR